MNPDARTAPGASRVARQVVAVWGVQLVLLFAQLGYTAIVSRRVDSVAFGQYATALAVVAAVSMFANAGLSNAATRRDDESVAADRRTLTIGLLTGFATAMAVVVTVPIWTRIWNDPSSGSAIAIMAASLTLGPAGAILAGALRRQGRIGSYNLVQLTASVLAMLVNLAVVLHYQSAWALALLPVLTSVFVFAGGSVALGRRALPTTQLSGVRQDVQFGVKSMSLWAVAVVGNFAPVWALRRFCGSAVLGQWNRAQVVGRLPFETGVRGLLTVIFPKLRGARRHDVDTSRTWSSMVAVSALLVLPIGFAVLPATPAAIRVLLGAQWTVAAQMVPYVAVGGIGLVLNLIVANALEASAFFRLEGLANAGWLAVNFMGVVATAISGSWLGVAVAIAIAPVVANTTQLWLCARNGLIFPKVVAAWYAVALGCATIAGGVSWLLIQSVATPVAQLSAAMAVVFVTGGLLLLGSRRHRPVRRLLELLKGEDAAPEPAH